VDYGITVIITVTNIVRSGIYVESNLHQSAKPTMKVANAIAEVLKREGIDFIVAYPLTAIVEAAAEADIRTIIVRQERTGLHMADAVSRLSSGKRIGVFAMQQGPGAENAFGGVAQAYAESSPILVFPTGVARQWANVPPNFSSLLNYRNVTKWCDQVPMPQALPGIMRRAFSQLRNGRPGPVLVEIPCDVLEEEFDGPLDYEPSLTTRTAPDPGQVDSVAEILISARCPVIYAGQGVHYARAWDELRQISERLNAPVMTSLTGKSAFPENHPLALGTAGVALPKTVHHFLRQCDVILGIGCSFSETSFGTKMPSDKVIIHATLDPADLNKDLRVQHALLGDAQLTLQALLQAIGTRHSQAQQRRGPIHSEIKGIKDAWLQQWMPKLTSDEVPLSPYRIIWDLMHTVDLPNTIITHDAGSPRDQLSPFWQSVKPLSYIGWGKSTQLGYGLGLTMGAKLACPDKLAINVWGDAAIGHTGMDFETAVREKIPILSILFNNFAMAIEIPVMPVSQEKYGNINITGNYADMARAFGGHGERVTQPSEIIPAIKRGIQKTREGTASLLEFITAKEIAFSKF